MKIELDLGDAVAASALRHNLNESDGMPQTGDAHLVTGRASIANASAARLNSEPALASAPLIDLSDLSPPDGFVIFGDVAPDLAGDSVSSAGDINGDGFDDIIVGAGLSDANGYEVGEAYVIFGKAGGFANIDLSNLAAADGFRIRGDAAYDQAGHSVAGAGDVNGDGFDDIIIGAPYGDDGGSLAGQAYVIFGKAGGFTNIDLANPLTGGFVIQGDAVGDQAGFSVSSAGDVNGDGLDDLIVGARGGDDGGVDAGEAYVVFGKAGGSGTVDLSNLGARGFIIRGDTAYDLAGFSVASAGDVNGDGFDDLIVGAPGGDDGGSYAGEAYVVFGKSSGFATVDLSNLGAAGILIRGDAASDYAGFSVASAGDINGDGFDELIIGAPFGNAGGADAGQAYVIFGKAAFSSNIDLTNLGAAGFVIQGGAAFDIAGFSVSTAGDFNGDGFDDIIVGAPEGDDGGDYAGEAYVIYGKAGGFGTIDLSNLAATDGLIIQGDVAGDRAGSSVAAAGDVNGDGFDDVIVGAPYADDGYAYGVGEAYVIFGRSSDGPMTITGGAAPDNLIGGADDDLLRGMKGNDALQGNGGGDTLDGGRGSDWADYTSAATKVVADLKSPQLNRGDAFGDSFISIENLRGSSVNDVLSGDDGANCLQGLEKNDLLRGRDGVDTIAGGGGRDTLQGGIGDDRFDFASLDVLDADKILDFASGADSIALDSDVFGLPEGALAPGRFAVGSAAQDAGDRLIYDPTAGRLFFDADGTGAQAQVLIATLTSAPALGAGDFGVI